MGTPDRDQKPTQRAVDEVVRVLNLCPDSEYVPQAEEILAKCYEHMAGHHYMVGRFYYRGQHYSSAIMRLKRILRERHFESYEKMPQVYFYLAEALRRDGKIEESRIYFEQFLEKYPESRLVKKVTKRLAQLAEETEESGG